MPPSEPRPSSRASLTALDAQADRPARLQLIVALILFLVLVAIPLYLWRRPRADSVGNGGVETATSVAAIPTVLPTSSAAPPSDAKLALDAPKLVACHDPGAKKTPPEQCDHLVEVEKAIAKAIEDSASCVPKELGGGTIVFATDVSFKKKSLAVSTPKDGRSIKNAAVVAACQTAVKAKLQTMSLDNVAHQHARYRLSVMATWPGAIKP